METVLPSAIHRADADLPWVEYGSGIWRKVVRVGKADGLWITHTKFPPGVQFQKHRHTGPVLTFTLSGRWKYKEYLDNNEAGSFLFEPPGSVHTFVVPDDVTELTEVWFAVWGANLILDPAGDVVRVVDGSSTLSWYVQACEEQGYGTPNPIIA